ncbi:MAG: hypothetical protein ACOYMG_25865, partial [Candidatus Methylumidiphilus sp.]
PGVAASTYLDFTLQEVPGSPKLAAEPVAIPIGTKVQSVPGPGQQPQTFETVEIVEARSEWNAMPVLRHVTWKPIIGLTEADASGDKVLWLDGIGSGLAAGDVILILSQDRAENPKSKHWYIRVLVEVEEDRIRQLTKLAWANPLGTVGAAVNADKAQSTVFVFRQRAALFGHNAPDPRLIYSKSNPPTTVLTTDTSVTANLQWASFIIQNNVIDLDNAYPKITPGSWFALVANGSNDNHTGLPGSIWLYRAQSVGFLSRRDFGLAGKVTRLSPDTTNALNNFSADIRNNLVLAQSEPLSLTPIRPLDYPLYGSEILLDRLEPDIAPGRVLAVSGKRARIRVRKGMSDLTMKMDDGTFLILSQGESLRIFVAPEQLTDGKWQAIPPSQFGALLESQSNGLIHIKLLDSDGRLGLLEAEASKLELVPAEIKDETTQEIARIDKLPSAVGQVGGLSKFVLAAPLQQCYDRYTVAINANLTRATHGETVSEILGNGDARQANQMLALRQTPLTFVSAKTPSGRKSTLELRANDLLWMDANSLYAQGSTDKVFELVIDDEARTSVRFGDGIEGSRLPSGDHNIRATYRKGLGLAGNVEAEKLTNLLSRPLGVTGASNPEAASGGEDPEKESKARVNAPLT